ncbi:MAG: hypothetical protein F2563_04385 [Actinobacteria bacterium]|uniref:Unannotated protein n=1 Tax=freshwater metagenome TaxID=449393 RepID=A0A6J6EVQ6_9ZZZZ|nr:hypothetical protein [Actinomycetota bacterium]
MSRRIPFSEITVVFICPAHNEKYIARKNHMETLCAELGFKDVVHWQSGKENYPECLNLATIQVLEEFADEPILLLEDDVEAQGLREFEVPDDADAVYLGLSKLAGNKIQNKNLDLGTATFEPYSPEQVRVMNMLSAHAIYYNSPVFKRAVVGYLRSYIGTKYYNDVLLSRIQPCFRVYANKKPLFYQSNRFNGTNNMEYLTKFEIKLS